MAQYVPPADISHEVTITESKPRFMGTYSFVYIGMYRRRRVSVKVLQLVNKKSLHAMRRKMYRERDVWAGLKHPNIASFYGYAEPGGDFGDFGALISPWYDKGDAGRYLSIYGTSLDISIRSRMWLGVICGVSYLHTLSPIIIHGDLKPGNILLDDQLNPKICDFGLAHILLEEGSTGLTTTSDHSGTERYLAFELVGADDPCMPTMATDVFALGSIGLEFIFLQLPYANRKNNARGNIFLDIRNKVPPARRPSDLHIHFSDLWNILEECWQIDPSERPSAGTVQASFHQWYLTLLENLNAEREFEGNVNELSHDLSTDIVQAGDDVNQASQDEPMDLLKMEDNSDTVPLERLAMTEDNISRFNNENRRDPPHMTGLSRSHNESFTPRTANPSYPERIDLNRLLSVDLCRQLSPFNAVRQPPTLSNGDPLQASANEFATSPRVNEMYLWTSVHKTAITIASPRGITVGLVFRALGIQLFRTIKKDIWDESSKERQDEITHWFWHNRKYNSMPSVEAGIVYADLLGSSTLFAGLIPTEPPGAFIVQWTESLAPGYPSPLIIQAEALPLY